MEPACVQIAYEAIVLLALAAMVIFTAGAITGSWLCARRIVKLADADRSREIAKQELRAKLVAAVERGKASV